MPAELKGGVGFVAIKVKVVKGKCVRCSRPTDDCCYEVNHQGQIMEYCDDCFSCSSCQRKIDPDGRVIVDNRSDDIICDVCYARKSPECGVCHKIIVGSAAVVRGESYHMDCFKCANKKCGRLLEDEHYGTTPADWRCVPCFTLESDKCANCREPILDAKVIVQGKTYHSQCFVCTVCNRPVDSPAKKVSDKDGEYLCQQCHVRMSPKCGACRGPCDDKHVILHDTAFHPECLTCCMCDEPIDGPVFGSHMSEYKCSACNLANAPRCTKCYKPCVEAHVIANEEPYHPDCFKCSSCGKAGDQGMILFNDEFVCSKCHKPGGGGGAVGGAVAIGGVRKVEVASGSMRVEQRAGMVKKDGAGNHQVEFQMRKANQRTMSMHQDVRKRK